jgi:hypothetical protein
MATITVPARALPGARYDHRFFPAMIVVLTIVMVAGFAHTYFLAGLFRAQLPGLLIHIHGAVFTLWFVLLLVQSTLAATGRVNIHRQLGIAGIFVAAAMIPLGIMATAEWAHRMAPTFPRVRIATIMPVTELASFAVLATLAFLLRRRPAAHKRLILLATIGLIPAATARLGFLPMFDLHGANALRLDWAYSYVFLLLLVAYDLWSRRRLHPAAAWGGIFLIGLHQVAIPIAYSAPWNAVSAWMQSWKL